MKVKKYRLRLEKSLIDIFLPVLGWIFLCFITFGLAIPFFLFYMVKIVINNTVIEHYNTLD
ncbi:DUF6693 family protein [Pseudoalteromonas denitrificans]|uniref:DUF6693 family protein n=1 Tax=Pseudoalteromonas denitrificans TaxID=43656 RepID=UPI0026A291F2